MPAASFGSRNRHGLISDKVMPTIIMDLRARYPHTLSPNLLILLKILCVCVLLPCRAAVHFEMEAFDACAKDCDEAVERGRELRADYKIIARALTRKGNALAKQERYEDAIAAYHKALTEHRCAWDPWLAPCVL